MTNKEKFLAGKWFCFKVNSRYKQDLFSYCTSVKCIQTGNLQFYALSEVKKSYVLCQKSVFGKVVKVALKFSDLVFLEDNEAITILER